MLSDDAYWLPFISILIVEELYLIQLIFLGEQNVCALVVDSGIQSRLLGLGVDWHHILAG